MRSLLATLATLLILPSHTAPRANTGNDSFGTRGLAMKPLAAETRGALLDTVRNYLGNELATEIEQATDPDTGYIVLVNLENPGAPGEADSGTIAINVRYKIPAYMIAIVLAHEYQHAKRAHASDPTNPDARDPDVQAPSTGGNSCHQCNHALLRANDTALITGLICEPPLSTPSNLAQACDFYKKTRDSLNATLLACLGDGCTGCCGFTHVPTAAELTTPPPCCP